MAWNEKGRRHEERMKQMDIDAQTRMKQMDIDAQTRKDERHEAAEERNSNEKIEQMRASVEMNKARLIAEADKDDREKHAAFEMAKIEAQKSMNETAEQEETRRVEIPANRDIEISNNECNVKIKEYEFKEAACKELSKMFDSYLSATTESHKQEIEMLIHINENRKEKYLKTLESSRNQTEKLLSLSEKVTGQEKALYLNELADIENSIRNLQEEDKEADDTLISKLIDLKEVQKIEMASQQKKMIDTNSLLLGFNGKEQ